MPHAVDNDDDDADDGDDDDNCVEMQVLFAYILNSCAVQPLNAFVCILALDSGLWGSTRTRMLRTRLVKPANASCMHERESLYVCVVCVCCGRGMHYACNARTCGTLYANSDLFALTLMRRGPKDVVAAAASSSMQSTHHWTAARASTHIQSKAQHTHTHLCNAVNCNKLPLLH